MAEQNETVLKLHVDTSELDAFVEGWHQVLAEAGSSQTEREIARLADYLMDHFPDEIGEGSAVDNAIALLNKLRLARQHGQIAQEFLDYYRIELEDTRRRNRALAEDCQRWEKRVQAQLKIMFEPQTMDHEPDQANNPCPNAAAS